MGRYSGGGGDLIPYGTGATDSINISNTPAPLIFPVQAATGSAPSYVKGGLYFDTTLNKLMVGGATGWETVTSV